MRGGGTSVKIIKSNLIWKEFMESTKKSLSQPFMEMYCLGRKFMREVV